MATLYKVIGSREEGSEQTVQAVTPSDPKAGFRLRDLYEMLECTTVEVVNLHDGTILICDEEGTFKPNDINVRATKLYRNSMRGMPLIVPLELLVIVGSALHCQDSEFK